MIITLSAAFDSFTDDQWQPYWGAIENLLIAHANGWHLFVPSRASTEALSSFEGFSVDQKTVLRVHIAERLAVLLGQARSVTKRIECVPEGVDCVFRDDSLLVPLKSFSVLDHCLRSKLIVENPDTDGEFYAVLAEKFGADGSMVFPISLEKVHGGGDTTAARVRDAVQSPRPCLVIVDGDRAYPNCPEGDTATKTRKAFEKRAFLSSSLHVTPVKSAENFISPGLAKKFLIKREESLANAEAFEKLHAEETDAGRDPMLSALAYASMKKGVKAGHYRKGCQAFKSSVASLISHFGLAWIPPADNDDSNDEEKICPGVSSKYLEVFVATLISDPSFVLECERTLPASPFFHLLHPILQDVLAFGIAAERLPARIALGDVAA